MRKILFIPFFISFLFSIEGKVVFYDDTYILGDVIRVDESEVYIIPLGLDLPEWVAIENINELKTENELNVIADGEVKYLFANGVFQTPEDDWLGNYYDPKQDETAPTQASGVSPYLGSNLYQMPIKPNMKYYTFSAYGGMPVLYMTGFEGITGAANMALSVNLPYFEWGPFDLSPGLKAGAYSFEAGDSTETSLSSFSSAQLALNLCMDWTPIFYFLPENMHIGTEVSPSFNTGDGEAYLGGMGISLGWNFEYWFKDLPFAIRLFSHMNIIPQPEPFTDYKSGYITVGTAMLFVLKRHQLPASN